MPGNKIPLRQAALAVELVENEGLSEREAERRTGISDTTIRNIVRKVGHWGEIADKPIFLKYRQAQNMALEVSYRAGAAIGLQEAYKQEKLDKASHYQLVMASAIAIDKARLLAGEPTEITATINIHAIQGLDRLAAMLSQTLLPKTNDISRETIEINPEQKQGVKT